MEKTLLYVKALKKIAITGPECTGKTTLTQKLAEIYKTVWVPEYAREYIQQLNRSYHEEDLLKIARGQLAKEKNLQKKAAGWLFIDTEMLVIKIWAVLKFNRIPGEIEQYLKQQHYDLYILCGTDIPWEADPQREDPGTREKIYQHYQENLVNLGVPFIEVHGNLERRIDDVVRALRSI